MKYPKHLQDLIDCFMLFPGIGPKTAERLALFAVLKLDDEKINKFQRSLGEAYSNIKNCSVCGNLTEEDVCSICNDETREKTILVCEGTKEILAFEKTNQYKGYYHVLNGLISPMNGITPNDINIDKLLERLNSSKINKVIIATSATIAGEMTAMYIKNLLQNSPVEVYRIGYGLPAGGDIEYADDITLARSLEGIKRI